MSYGDYILISNFGIDYDALQHKFLDASSGHSFKDFFHRVTSIAEILGLEVVEFFEDSLVLRGCKQDVAFIEKYFGSVYTCAFIDESHLEMTRNCMNDTYVTEGVGTERFNGSQANSKIILRTTGRKYDA